MARFSPEVKIAVEETMRKNMRNAVYALLAEKELNAISVADVAKKINVSSVTVYNYYPSRKDLIDDAVNHSRRAIMDKLLEAGGISADPVETLLNLARVICNDFEEHRFLFMARFAAVPHDGENALSAKEYFKVIINCFASAISHGIELGIFRTINPEFAAMSLLGALMSFNRHASFKWIELSVDERLAEIKNIIIEGFKNKETQNV